LHSPAVLVVWLAQQVGERALPLDDFVDFGAGVTVFALAPGAQHRAFRQEKRFPLVAADADGIAALG
jgi:hypothetical protein